ncbi:MAG: hypothetical protein WCO83_00360 [Alphaproteobacteria bacterium]
MSFQRSAVMALTITLAAAAAHAQPAAPQIIRGAVTAASADALTIKGKDGKPITVTMVKGWTVALMKPITVDAIQPGSFIGTSEMPQADGNGKSLEVHVFPPGVKMGEGHYDWNLKKGSMMTNGTVGKVVKGKNGQELDVAYSYGTRHIVVPKKVPIVQITAGDRSMIKPGAKVFLIAQSTATGLISNSVSTGEGGKAPPM